MQALAPRVSLWMAIIVILLLHAVNFAGVSFLMVVGYLAHDVASAPFLFFLAFSSLTFGGVLALLGIEFVSVCRYKRSALADFLDLAAPLAADAAELQLAQEKT